MGKAHDFRDQGKANFHFYLGQRMVKLNAKKIGTESMIAEA